MKIKKIGHCCLVVQIGNKRVMTDPGSYSIDGGQEEEKNIDLIVFTHEHSDHLHLESLKKIIINNPAVIVVTNSAVGKILADSGISHEILEDGGSGEFAGVYLEAHGYRHAFIRSGVEPVQNTGYFIGKDLFYPGDAFTNPNKKIDILALPVGGPWLKIEESLEYVKNINPVKAFPVHDGMFNKFGHEYIKRVLPDILKSFGTEFKVLELGKEEEI